MMSCQTIIHTGNEEGEGEVFVMKLQIGRFLN